MSPAELPAPERLLEVKAGLVDAFTPGGTPVGDLKHVLDHEPKQAPGMPLLTMMTRGFRRGSLSDSTIERDIRDPLMGRRWVWLLDVRVWVAVRSDEQAAQRSLDVLAPTVVVALETDPTLGGVANNSVLSSGDAVLVRPREGNPTLMLTCACSVETEEPLT